MEKIINRVASYYKLSIWQLNCKSRKGLLPECRHVIFYLIRETYPEISLEKIGQWLNRDHASVMHGIKKVGYYLDTDKDFRAKLAEIRKYIYKPIFNKIYKPKFRENERQMLHIGQNYWIRANRSAI